MAKLNIDISMKVNEELKAYYEAKISALIKLVNDAYEEAAISDDEYEACDIPPTWENSCSKRELEALLK